MIYLGTKSVSLGLSSQMGRRWIGEIMHPRRATVVRVFLTRNSEYHLVGCECVGVRDRRSGKWYEAHPAQGMALSGSFVDGRGQLHPTALPRLGESLRLTSDSKPPVQTSAVLAIEAGGRPLPPRSGVELSTPIRSGT